MTNICICYPPRRRDEIHHWTHEPSCPSHPDFRITPEVHRAMMRPVFVPAEAMRSDEGQTAGSDGPLQNESSLQSNPHDGAGKK